MSLSVGIRITPLSVAILIAIALWFLPRFTRPDLYFAVTVAPGFRDTAVALSILRRYRTELIGVSVLTLTLIAVCALTPAFRLAPLVLLLQVAGCFAVFYRARRLVLPHAISPTTVREAQLAERDRRIFGGWVVASGPFALLVACASYLWMHWQQIPGRLVVHWGGHGQPDRWAARSFGSVFFPLLSVAAILVALTLVLYGIGHWLRPIYAGGLQGARESRFRRTASALLVAVEYFLALQASWIAIQPLRLVSHQGPGGIVLLFPLLIAIATVAVLMPLGQGGSTAPRSGRAEPAASEPVGDRTEDRYWKLGVFYFNRDDPAVLVEKRFGIGYSFNFARPMFWIVLVLVVLLPIAIARF